jgi:hypothetical protein
MARWPEKCETECRRRPYEIPAQYFDFVREISPMLRTIFSIGLFAVLGLIALRFIFGIFGVLMGLFMTLLFLAIKIAIVGLLIYFVIRIVSPDTARRLRERWSGRAA